VSIAPAMSTSAPVYHGSSLDLVGLSMAYGSFDVVRDVTVHVPAGTTTCVIGPSGSGKSTLLRGINRLHEPKSGDVLIAGESTLGVHPDQLRRRIGLVFRSSSGREGPYRQLAGLIGDLLAADQHVRPVR